MDKPSQLIRQHIGGDASGYALDDLMSRRTGGMYDDVLKRIIAIHERFRTTDYPIGTSNPKSFAELEILARELELKGY